jgi:hypothetical protein
VVTQNLTVFSGLMRSESSSQSRADLNFTALHISPILKFSWIGNGHDAMLEVGLKVVLVDPSVAAEVMLAKCSPAISATIFLRMAQVLDASTIRG